VFDGSPSSYLIHTQRGWLHLKIKKELSNVYFSQKLRTVTAGRENWTERVGTWRRTRICREFWWERPDRKEFAPAETGDVKFNRVI
jgi:hypothetical protein